LLAAGSFAVFGFVDELHFESSFDQPSDSSRLPIVRAVSRSSSAQLKKIFAIGNRRALETFQQIR